MWVIFRDSCNDKLLRKAKRSFVERKDLQSLKIMYPNKKPNQIIYKYIFHTTESEYNLTELERTSRSIFSYIQIDFNYNSFKKQLFIFFWLLCVCVRIDLYNTHIRCCSLQQSNGLISYFFDANVVNHGAIMTSLPQNFPWFLFCFLLIKDLIYIFVLYEG